MGPEALPPCRHISSTSITHEVASDILSTYLRNSESHPHLHPDALITPTGVTFSSHAGSMGGVILHNLRRVAAGLRGEHLEPEPSPEPEERQDGEGFKSKKKRFVDEEPANTTAVADEEWQDLAEYERQQEGVEVGEIGDRDHFVTSGGDVPEVDEAAGGDEVEVVGEKRKAKGHKTDDKEARKKAKKERQKEFKRDKEKKKRAEAEE